MYEQQKSVTDLTAIELQGMAFLRTKDHMSLWYVFKRNLTDRQMQKLCETEFDQAISEIVEQ